jgi:hypothetical protein
VPTSSIRFWTSEVTPSVINVSSASTSFVIRLMIAPVRLRSKYPRDSRCRWPNSRILRSASARSPTQPVT